MNVPQRKLILIHPANDAMQELQGCNAPVSLISGAGSGLNSRMAVDALASLVYKAPDLRDRVLLNIKSDAL
jgi:hypothetical protein